MPGPSSVTSQPHATTIDSYATTPEVDSQPRPESQPGGAGLSAPVLATLEAMWAAIRDRHPDVPAVVVVLAAGSIGAPRGTLRLGHFAAMRWHHREDVMPEVMIGGEGLSRGPLDVLGTLLHEAAHALAHARGIKDTSHGGRYHNERFASLARELALDARQIGSIGWSDTTLTETTALDYATELAQLADALVIHRRAEGAPITTTGGNNDDQDDNGDTGDEPGDKPNSRNPSACTCACPRRIRVARSVLALGAITCAICGSEFVPAA